MLTGLGTALFGPVVDLYIRRERSRLMTTATPLTGAQIESMLGHFSSEILGSVHVVVAEPLPITDPPFLNLVHRFGFEFARPSLTQAITFDRVIAAWDYLEASVLFHELVHVVQYHVLGGRAFAHEYVRGFLDSRNYFSIPLEQCAFDLQFRYESGSVFNAERETRRF